MAVPKPKATISGVDESLVRELRDVIARPAAAPPPQHPLDAFMRPPGQGMLAGRPRRQDRWSTFLSLIPWFLGAGAVIAGLLYVSVFGLRAKNRVIEQGNAAIGNLLEARQDIERMDWSAAGDAFSQASSRFDDASRQLGVLAPVVTSFLSKVPGMGGLSAGSDIVSAGRLLADAGQDISTAVAALGRAGQHAPDAKDVEMTEALDELDGALTSALGNIVRAEELLADVDPEHVPDDFRAEFTSFRERLPAIRAMVQQGVGMVGFIRRFMGDDHPRRYLVLFQNSSELRPTGGFPGSYGLLTTEGGKVKDWRADDIYNPDGQIKELIVPPLQLQHITPGWGMRDANWFADFTVSARKVMEYWRKGGGEAVDGVLAVRPDVLAGILEVIGPVSLPDYDVVLDSGNVIATLQTEVEQNRPTGKPKQIIADLAPIVLDRLATLPGERTPAIMAQFAQALERRDVLMYFNDPDLQAFADERGWSGRIEGVAGDYLMVNVSNIAGAKTDAVTDTALKLESRLEQGTLVHRLTITRRHDGGATGYGFYDKPNISYVRVLVPRGSTLRGISGNETPYHRPLMEYTDAVRDDDLQRLEATYVYDRSRDLVTYEESDKTGFGFWMRIEPEDVGKVQIEYAVPAAVAARNYRLLVQRQPGLDVSDLEITFDKPGLMVGESSPDMVEWPDSWRLHTGLEHDLVLEATLR